ncbi:MAG: AzlD domain-containing protein [Alphaproteobacteria bacterium]|nr:AzlD domain-containing protein [Alphaproteobacteria bacterium]
MLAGPDALWAILALAAVSYACRTAGFWLMGFVTITPRVERALRAIPVATMVAIVAPAAARGGVPEIAGIAVALAAARLAGNDILATVAGVAAVAAARAAGA